VIFFAISYSPNWLSQGESRLRVRGAAVARMAPGLAFHDFIRCRSIRSLDLSLGKGVL